MNAENLSNKAWYRLVKVLYGLGLALLALLVLATFISTRPSGRVLMEKSGFTCADGESYLWTHQSNYYSGAEVTLNDEDHLLALKTCNDKSGNRLAVTRKSDGQTGTVEESDFDSKLYELRETKSNHPSYQISWVTDDNFDNWKVTITWTLLALAVGLIILDTIRNIIVYVVTGVWLSYWWLKK